MTAVRAWAAHAAGRPLEPFAYEAGPLGAEEVEIAVEHCGICHTDLALMDSQWSPTTYPVVPGHEVIGRVAALGSNAKRVKVGQRVGLGYYAGSCTHCGACLRGEPNLCAQRRPTITGLHGAFADRVRAHWIWATPVPDGLDPAVSAPLMCAGVTVFSPLWLHGINATHRVGVVGIGGLGHLALQFSRAWGCEVTAFTSNPGKRDEAMALGAHRVISSLDASAMARIAGSLDLIIWTAKVAIDWNALIDTLAPKGRLHLLGVVTSPLPIMARPHLIAWQRSLSGTSTGSPAALAAMLDFAARHRIAPRVERFPMHRINDAIAHLRSGKSRYRIVLDADHAPAPALPAA